MKTVLILIMFFVLAGAAYSQVPEKYEAFYQEHKEFAQRLSESSGVPVSVIFAIATQESACGGSWLAQRSNNVTGYQCGKSWKGDFVQASEGKFRKYITIRESLADFAISQARRNPALTFKNFNEWCSHALYYGGSDTRKYWNKIRSIIKAYDLNKFDLID